ncbi:uncharacterized protein BX663DRAFT_487763 [Cokeromyces recurvatus]|uniref:uncharacterized protein n=1 Tax=Cokeromyces recurvatus TaxID=90255 RepID=UPI0022205E05|nr:uncharacterized protein BX663DRAFT_487763 [Cokeromyces recurvatus]KAI7901182.1 hypothetical protein BX663DRAFT_487763 [Cokeromyces recurvatus]
MKAKINLYSYRQSSNRRIDTYQIATTSPYDTNLKKANKKELLPIIDDRENRLKAAAYSVNHSQACLLLQAIQMNGRRRLSSECILQLALFVVKAWEAKADKEAIDGLVKLINNLLNSTLLCPDMPFDEALRQFCRNNIPTQSVSPSITLLIAIGYIERLKQRYHHIKGTAGCGQRLVLVAYMMAAKYMHVNLRSIIDTTTTSTPTTSTTTLISAERSTIKDTLTTQLPPIIPPTTNHLPPSPPTSPKSFSQSDPFKYHYFQSSNQKESKTTQERQFQILRMELEFLHFLNYDLSLTDTLKLIHWAQKFDDDDILPTPITTTTTTN